VAAHFAESGFSVTAVDISPLAVRWTERQHPVITAAVLDIENEPIRGSFDSILCLEVLQQVRNPIDVLRKLRDAMAPNGCLIVSLPNEFHLARRLSILLGRVNFGGIEDTHIKLYTPREHRLLFARCGLVVEMVGTQSIMPPRWFNGRLHDLTAPLAQHWPSMFALSCVYRLSRKEVSS
jgi:SAM-dependent methyltransferase